MARSRRWFATSLLSVLIQGCRLLPGFNAADPQANGGGSQPTLDLLANSPQAKLLPENFPPEVDIKSLALAPDGKTIAFSARGVLYLGQLGSSAPATAVPAAKDVSDITWDGSSDRIAFLQQPTSTEVFNVSSGGPGGTSYSFGDCFQVSALEISDKHIETLAPEMCNAHAKISPDGLSVAALASSQPSSPGPLDLFILSGSTSSVLVAGASDLPGYEEFGWSQDSKGICYVSYSGDTPGTVVARFVTMDGEFRDVLTFQPVPGGHFIGATSKDTIVAGEIGTSSVGFSALDPASLSVSETSVSLEPADKGGDGLDDGYLLSPDGRSLVGYGVRDMHWDSIVVASLDDGKLRNFPFSNVIGWVDSSSLLCYWAGNGSIRLYRLSVN